MIDQVKKVLYTHHGVSTPPKIVVGFSGGVDSVVLSLILKNIGAQLILAHCNFQLRGEESDEDEQFCKRFANENELPIQIKKFDTSLIAKQESESIQVASRKLRYDWFNTILKEHNFDWIATGHHKNDDIETVMFNVVNANIFDGLRGIPEVNGRVIRPLLKVTKETIYKYIAEHKIDYREDSSNKTLKYQRNKIRHKIIPELLTINKGLYQTFDAFKTQSDLLLTFANDKYEKWEENINRDAFLNYSDLLSSETKLMLFLWMKKNDFTTSDYNDLIDIVSLKKPGKQIISKSKKEIWSEHSGISLKQLSSASIEFSTEVKELNFSELSSDFPNINSEIWIDTNKVKGDLILRRFKKGDAFVPLGMKGKKKLSDLFTDEKFSPQQKLNSLILVDRYKQDGEIKENIIWIVGLRMSERYKLTSKTTKVWSVKLMKMA